MVRRRVGADAFAIWAAMPESERSFAAVAKILGVDRSSVFRTANRERWRKRLEKLEPQVARRTEEKIDAELVESLSDVRARQARIGKELQERGLEALEKFDIVDTKDALKAIDLGTRIEAQAREMNTKKVDVSVSHTLKERFERYVTEAPPPQLTDGRAPALEIEFPSLEEIEAEVADE